MLSHIRAAVFTLLLAAIPPAVSAADRALHPADPDVPVPATAYQSAFTSYHKAGFEEKVDWRRANDAVREAGGHAGMLQDSGAPAQAPPPHGHRMPMQPDMPRMMPGHHHEHQHGQGKRP